MNFKTKVKFVILCALAMVLCVLCAGCIGEMTAWEFLEGQNAMQGVTYYANGGWFGEIGQGKETIDMYYRENADIISDDFECVGDTNYHLIRPGYIFLGWYAAKVDADGNPDYLCYDENGNQVSADADNIAVKLLQISDTPADLSKIKKDEHRYFCADWLKEKVLLVKLVSDQSITLDKAVTIDGEEFAKGHTFNSGDSVGSAIFPKSGTVSLSGITVAEGAEHTFLQYYKDAECTQPIDRYTRGENGEGEDEDSEIYAKYISGKHVIVKDASGVANMLLNLNSGNSYYFFNTVEKKEIDMDNRSVTLKTGECNIKIAGNGFTIKNLTYNPGRGFITASSNYSILGKLTKDASIKDLTFQDITLNIQVRANAVASFFAITREAEAGATLENVAIDGIKMTMTIPATSSISNIPLTDGVYVTNNWLFGGEGSDEAFIQRFTTVSVSGAEIEINK